MKGNRPAVAGMFMQTHRLLLSINGTAKYFPFLESYDLIFLAGLLLSGAAIVLAILLSRQANRMAIPNLRS